MTPIKEKIPLSLGPPKNNSITLIAYVVPVYVSGNVTVKEREQKHNNSYQIITQVLIDYYKCNNLQFYKPQSKDSKNIFLYIWKNHRMNVCRFYP